MKHRECHYRIAMLHSPNKTGAVFGRSLTCDGVRGWSQAYRGTRARPGQSVRRKPARRGKRSLASSRQAGGLRKHRRRLKRGVGSEGHDQHRGGIGTTRRRRFCALLPGRSSYASTKGLTKGHGNLERESLKMVERIKAARWGVFLGLLLIALGLGGLGGNHSLLAVFERWAWFGAGIWLGISAKR